MNKLVVVGAVSLVAIFGGWLVYSKTDRAAQASSAAQSDSGTLEEFAARGKALTEAAGSKSLTPGPVNTSQVDSSQLLNADPRLVALSKAELAWLEKHYYPTQRELDGLDAMSIEELGRADDPKSRTLYGLALIKRGEVPAAIAALNNAASQGAVYAYEEGAIAEHAMLKERNGDPETVDAMLRAKLEVARMMGDHRVDYLLEKYLPNQSSTNPATVQTYTTEFMRQLGSNAQLLGVPAAGPDPRPNLDQWNDISKLGQSAGASTQVDVYRRD